MSSVSRALRFIGGVPRAIVPDQLKSAVVGACRYEPAIQRTTADLARHYATTTLPARPRSPRDKAKAEAGVLIAERWLLARIRNERFTSLGALNARLAELTSELNGRTMRVYNASRRDLFERIDKPALAPLPAEPFEPTEWKKLSLNIDYHVEFDLRREPRAAREPGMLAAAARSRRGCAPRSAHRDRTHAPTAGGLAGETRDDDVKAENAIPAGSCDPPGTTFRT